MLFLSAKLPYTDREKRLGRYNQVCDAIGVLVFGELVLLLSMLHTSFPPLKPSLFRTVGAAATALMATHAGYCHICVNPWQSEKSESYFRLMKLMGRNIYLTRHAIVLQMTLMWFGLIAEIGNWFEQPWVPAISRATYGHAVFVHSLGAFATIQYFRLVAPAKDFQDECDMYKKKSFPYEEIQWWAHAWGLVVAVLDLSLIKDRAGAAKSLPSVSSHCIGMILFCIYYLGLVFFNRLITGEFPYEVLKELKGVSGWLAFLAVQATVLIVFGFALSLLTLIPAVF